MTLLEFGILHLEPHSLPRRLLQPRSQFNLSTEKLGIHAIYCFALITRTTSISYDQRGWHQKNAHYLPYHIYFSCSPRSELLSTSYIFSAEIKSLPHVDGPGLGTHNVSYSSGPKIKMSFEGACQLQFLVILEASLF